MTHSSCEVAWITERRKDEKTQHAQSFVGLGSSALADAVAFTQARRPKFPEMDNKVFGFFKVKNSFVYAQSNNQGHNNQSDNEEKTELAS